MVDFYAKSGYLRSHKLPHQSGRINQGESLLSWTIYHGMILKNATLEQAFAKAKALRATCLSHMRQTIGRKACEVLAFKADLAQNVCWLNEDDITPMPVMKQIEAAKEAVDGRGVREPEWDYTFDLVFMPWQGHILTLYFVENDPGYHEAMLKLGFEEFQYFNNTDRPEGISEQEWSMRFDAWEAVGLMDYEAPSTLGLSYQVVSWHDIRDVAEWWFLLDREAVAMSDQRRRQAVAEKLVCAEMDADLQGQQLTVSDLIKQTMKRYPERTPQVQLADVASITFDFHDLF